MARTRNPFYGRYEWKERAAKCGWPLASSVRYAANLTPQGLHVHHRKPLKHAPALAYEPLNLMTLCNACHTREEPRNGMPSKGCDAAGIH